MTDEPQSSADSAVAIRKPVFKPPFEVYHNGNEIGDTNGPVCTAEDEETAQALVLALNAHFTQPQASAVSAVPMAHPRHNVYFMCQCCEEENPENAVCCREDIGIMPDGTWLCDNCYSDCEKTAYGLVANDVEDFEFPSFEDLPRPAPYIDSAVLTEPQSLPLRGPDCACCEQRPRKDCTVPGCTMKDAGWALERCQAVNVRNWPRVFNVQRSKSNTWHGEISFARCPTDAEIQAVEILLRDDHQPAPTLTRPERKP